jgi:energy-coupling factor transporter ATP-binding protein EcfA2
MASDGLTTVYGENGSGKTGYARVLKHACHSRHSEAVMTDVFGAKTALGSANIEYAVNGIPTTVSWSAGGAPIPALRGVHVFDAKCAHILVDDANDVVFEPEALAVLSKLAAAVMHVRQHIDSEQALIPIAPQAVETLKGTHEVGRLVETLSDKTDPKQIDVLAAVTDADRARRDALSRTRAEIQAMSYELKAKTLRALLNGQLLPIREEVAWADACLSDMAFAEAKAAQQEQQAASEASTLAAQAFRTDGLPGLGSSDAWRVLFEAARHYSEGEAYPGHPFPHVTDDARCVLCQQKLSEGASTRLLSLEAFVQADAEKRAGAARRKVAALVGALREMTLKASAIEPAVVQELSAFSGAIPAALDSYRTSAIARRDAVLRGLSDGTWDVPSLSSSPLPQLDELIDDIRQQIGSLDILSTPAEHSRVETEFIELDARIRLADNKDIIVKEVARLVRVAALVRASEEATTLAISHKQSQISEQLLTEELRAAVTEELKAFGLQRFAFQLRKTVVKGQTRHQLRLQDASVEVTNLSRVLSDGEQNVVALAAFLAEARLAGAASLLLDDPITSLDHKWMRRIARRLVETGASRQVVVFTHDIAFLLTLKEEAGLQQVVLVSHSVSRGPGGPGHCEADTPWEAQSYKERLGPLGKLLDEARKEHKTNGESPTYERLHGEFYGKLRATWERVVEECLMGQVVMRFRGSIETNRLKSVVIEDSDIVQVVRAMTAASAYIPAHDHAAPLGRVLLEPQELDGHLSELRDYCKGLDLRQKKARSEREAQLEPPSPAASSTPVPVATLPKTG